MGVDVVSSIFEVDVAQEIERLKMAIANPQEQQIAGELRACAEVFSGFGEMLNLPGFSHLAQTIHKVLDKHPAHALAITKIAVADFDKARAQVLAGDRVSGGEPSPELLQWLAMDAAAAYHHQDGEVRDETDETGETFDFGEELNLATMDLGEEEILDLQNWSLEAPMFQPEATASAQPTANELALEELSFESNLDLPPELGDMDLFGEEVSNDDEIDIDNVESSFSMIDPNDHAYRFFIEEVPELLHNIEQGLLTIRDERSTNLVHEIMRSAHSIKGEQPVWD
ncbi:MAG: hypothetical protein HC796_01330 [Synechococcaceae cyanobacterium RL_1_2]|nr:hypothetical protein [Synechococcaceae cyanobacterium RL_1_2]